MAQQKRRERASAEEISLLFRELKRTGSQETREKLVENHMNLVHFFARRFSTQAEYYDDLCQVATLGLINAIDRFDTERNVEFVTFATVTIMGEIKRYFRDKTWAIKVPRRIKDLNISVNHAIEKLSKELDRAPTYDDVAREVGVSVEEILESREAVQSYQLVSLDREIDSDSDSPTTLMSMIGNVDRQLDMLGDRLSLQAGLKSLKEEERLVIYHRFFSNLAQAQIAKMMGVSQMQVSRIQTQALEKLKRLLSR